MQSLRQPAGQCPLAASRCNHRVKNINMNSAHALDHTTLVVHRQPFALFDSQQLPLYRSGMSKESAPQTIGQRIAAAREAKCLDQRQLSELIGISQQAISKIERGESRDPQASTILKISQATGCDLLWLLSGEASSDQPANQPSQEPQQLARTLNAMRLAYLSNSIDDDGLHALRLLLESMRKRPPTGTLIPDGSTSIANSLRSAGKPDTETE